MINRKEMKKKARAAMRGRSPGVMIFVMPYTQVTLSNYYNYLSGWKPETPELPNPEIEI